MTNNKLIIFSEEDQAALEDYRSHHNDWRTACQIAKLATMTHQADADYWEHQIKTLDRIAAGTVEFTLPEGHVVPPNLGCQVPPAGWWCSREPGHPGPCAAYPNSVP